MLAESKPQVGGRAALGAGQDSSGARI